jgi:hypothetical protein
LPCSVGNTSCRSMNEENAPQSGIVSKAEAKQPQVVTMLLVDESSLLSVSSLTNMPFVAMFMNAAKQSCFSELVAKAEHASAEPFKPLSTEPSPSNISIISVTSSEERPEHVENVEIVENAVVACDVVQTRSAAPNEYSNTKCAATIAGWLHGSLINSTIVL